VAASDARVWTQVLNVNLVSIALLARGLLPELVAAAGSIVNVTSIVGSRVHPFAGVTYAASKAKLSTLTRELAYEFGPLGVRANATAPGEIETSILSPGTDELVAKQVPLKRLGDPREVAETVHFLCTGACILHQWRGSPH
jgi:NAD(P)-dependent dehydrogenase (short-subunit alcohol dehydrogenase family)